MQLRYEDCGSIHEEFYRLSSRCNLSLTEEEQALKYINGLKYSIQEHVTFQDIFSIDEA